MSSTPFQPGDIISHHEMCGHERTSLQKGMNFRLHGIRSVFLMSTRKGAPYEDRILSDGKVLVYEGHDVPRKAGAPDPKSVDQPLRTPKGTPTANGLFYQAAEDRGATADFERVWVYEKIKAGIWVYNGCFALRSAEMVQSGGREVCRFSLELVDDATDTTARDPELEHTRLIPSAVKQTVWKRDGGKCVQCGSGDNLHFDHNIPFSKGGTSVLAENIQLLCARHNLEKSAKII